VPLGTEVGLVPGHIVLDGTQLPKERGTAAPTFAVYGGRKAYDYMQASLRPYETRPMSIIAYGWMDQDTTW